MYCIFYVFLLFYNVLRIFSAEAEKSKRMGRVVMKLQAFKDSRCVITAQAGNT